MLKNMVAVVTGSAHGLGRQTVDRFLAEGLRVVGCDIVDDFQEPVTHHSENFHFEKADVREAKDVENVIGQAMERFGRINYVVNCAGIGGAYKIYSSQTGIPTQIEDFQRVLDINVMGSFNISRIAAREMAKNNPDKEGTRGMIINTSGTAGRDGIVAQSAISAACGAINSMTLPMARDLASVGIRVATISPGLFVTPLTGSLDKQVLTFFSNLQPFPHRLGKPEEYSDLVIQLIQNSQINGEVLYLDAGLRTPGY